MEEELDEENEVPFEEPIDGMLALRLAGVDQSSRVGMLDQGFPNAMLRLQALGFVEHKVTTDGSGYAITNLGRAYLIERKRRYPNE